MIPILVFCIGAYIPYKQIDGEGRVLKGEQDIERARLYSIDNLRKKE